MRALRFAFTRISCRRASTICWSSMVTCKGNSVCISYRRPPVLRRFRKRVRMACINVRMHVHVMRCVLTFECGRGPMRVCVIEGNTDGGASGPTRSRAPDIPVAERASDAAIAMHTYDEESRDICCSCMQHGSCNVYLGRAGQQQDPFEFQVDDRRDNAGDTGGHSGGPSRPGLPPVQPSPQR